MENKGSRINDIEQLIQPLYTTRILFYAFRMRIVDEVSFVFLAPKGYI